MKQNYFCSIINDDYMSIQYKILVAEDEYTNALLLKKILTNKGYQTEVAYNGAEAFAFLEKDTFHVLLADWMMPVMDGIELIRRTIAWIKPKPYIIMVTALASSKAENYARASGADDYIAKPINNDDLLERVVKGIEKISEKLMN
ncbi:MAG: response regulator [Bacteroidetes bacterium]|nr:MAG: response regulator [Bacteroidota bacterium]